jgi:hypothetical protein
MGEKKEEMGKTFCKKCPSVQSGRFFLKIPFFLFFPISQKKKKEKLENRKFPKTL